MTILAKGKKMLGSRAQDPAELPTASPTQGADLPEQSGDRHLTFIQLQLGILSPALRPVPVSNVDVSSQRASTPTARGTERGWLLLVNSEVRPPLQADVSLQKQVPIFIYLLFLFIICFVVSMSC